MHNLQSANTATQADLEDALDHLGPVVVALDLVAKHQVLGHNISIQHRLGELCLAVLPYLTEGLGTLHQLQHHRQLVQHSHLYVWRLKRKLVTLQGKGLTGCTVC